MEITYKHIRYILFNGLLITGLYLGVYKEIPGAANLVLFYVWAAMILSIIFCNDKSIQQFKEKKFKHTISKEVDAIFDLSVICIFVWFGWFWTGLAYLIHFFCLQYIMSEVEDSKDDKECSTL